MGGNMKVHQYEFPRGMLIRSWDQQSQLIESASPASLSSFCQRFRPLLPSSHTTSGSNSSTAFRFDLKSFIKPHHCSSNETNVVSSGSDDKVGDHRLTQVLRLLTLDLILTHSCLHGPLQLVFTREEEYPLDYVLNTDIACMRLGLYIYSTC